jgi:hypothetical protein
LMCFSSFVSTSKVGRKKNTRVRSTESRERVEEE